MKKWEKIINITPSLHQFASGAGSNFGVTRNATDVRLKRAFIETCFDVITEGTRKHALVTPTDIESLGNIDFPKTTVIMCANEKAKFEHGGLGDHWVTLVGKDVIEDSYLVACSYTLHQHGLQERIDEATGHVYNSKISASKIRKSNVYENSLCKICIVDR